MDTAWTLHARGTHAARTPHGHCTHAARQVREGWLLVLSHHGRLAARRHYGVLSTRALYLYEAEPHGGAPPVAYVPLDALRCGPSQDEYFGKGARFLIELRSSAPAHARLVPHCSPNPRPPVTTRPPEWAGGECPPQPPLTHPPPPHPTAPVTLTPPPP